MVSHSFKLFCMVTNDRDISGFVFFWKILLIDKWKIHMQKTVKTFHVFTDQCRIISCHKSLRALCWFQKICGIFTTDFRISIVILHASKKKSVWFSSKLEWLIPWQSLLVYVEWSLSVSERKDLCCYWETDHLFCLCKSKVETLIILEKRCYNIGIPCHCFSSCTYIFFSKLLVCRLEGKRQIWTIWTTTFQKKKKEKEKKS